MKGESRQTRNVYTWDVGGGEVGEGVPGVDVDGSGQVSTKSGHAQFYK